MSQHPEVAPELKLLEAGVKLTLAEAEQQIHQCHLRRLDEIAAKLAEIKADTIAMCGKAVTQ